MLNHGQLVMEYIRQGEQLANAIEQLRDAIKNSEFSTSLTFGAISRDINLWTASSPGGQALAYSLGNLDALFAETFPGYHIGESIILRQYRKWSQATLFTYREAFWGGWDAEPADGFGTGRDRRFRRQGAQPAWSFAGFAGASADLGASSTTANEIERVYDRRHVKQTGVSGCYGSAGSDKRSRF